MIKHTFISTASHVIPDAVLPVRVSVLILPIP